MVARDVSSERRDCYGLTRGPPLTRTRAKARRTRTDPSPSSRAIFSRSSTRRRRAVELIAQLEDDFDAGQVDAHVAREREDGLQALERLLVVEAGVAGAARRTQQPFTLVQPQRLRMDLEALGDGADHEVLATCLRHVSASGAYHSLRHVCRWRRGRRWLREWCSPFAPPPTAGCLRLRIIPSIGRRRRTRRRSPRRPDRRPAPHRLAAAPGAPAPAPAAPPARTCARPACARPR